MPIRLDIDAYRLTLDYIYVCLRIRMHGRVCVCYNRLFIRHIIILANPSLPPPPPPPHPL